MGLIRVQNVTKQFGGQVVLSDVSLELPTGQTAALIGPNGAGKTTLFRIIAGQIPPDTGTVTSSRGLEVGYLPQDAQLPAADTLRDAVADAFADLMAMERRMHALADRMAAEHDGPELAAHMAEYDRIGARFEAAGGYQFEQRLNEILGGLGFRESDHALPVQALSGGQKCRAALARLLLQERQFLLLDEPTNHLDIDAVRWLEKFLAGHHGGALIVSHDRYLLDRLVTRVIELEPSPTGGRVASYSGNYTQFVEARRLRRLTRQRQYEKDRERIEKERAFINKHLAGQRTAEAKGRRKRLERELEEGRYIVEGPATERRTARLAFGETSRRVQRDKEVLRVAGLAKSYGEKGLFEDVSLSLYGGQRVGITGPNGTGKTTLLKILLGQVSAEAGETWLDPRARIGYFAQDAGELHPERTIVEEIIAVRPDLLERDARHVAAQYLFTGEDPFKRLGALSGGEQSRVRFMKLILTSPDVLILDEPTNHLDIPSRELLEASLVEFPGTILAVSHDRYFLDRVAEKLLVMRPEGHALYNGNYSYYIGEVERQRSEAEASVAAAARVTRGPAQPGQRRAGPHGSADGRPVSRFAKWKLDELEAFIAGHEARIAALNERFGDPGVYRDGAAIQQLRSEFDELKTELAEAESEWLARAE